MKSDCASEVLDPRRNSSFTLSDVITDILFTFYFDATYWRVISLPKSVFMILLFLFLPVVSADSSTSCEDYSHVTSHIGQSYAHQISRELHDGSVHENKVIDKNIYTCTKTRCHSDYAPWWRLDMGSEVNVSKVTIYPSPTDVSNLVGMDILISATSPPVGRHNGINTLDFSDYTLCNTIKGPIGSNTYSLIVACRKSVIGRYIAVRKPLNPSQKCTYLHICEVDIWKADQLIVSVVPDTDVLDAGKEVKITCKTDPITCENFIYLWSFGGRWVPYNNPVLTFPPNKAFASATVYCVVKNSQNIELGHGYFPFRELRYPPEYSRKNPRCHWRARTVVEGEATALHCFVGEANPPVTVDYKYNQAVFPSADVDMITKFEQGFAKGKKVEAVLEIRKTTRQMNKQKMYLKLRHPLTKKRTYRLAPVIVHFAPRIFLTNLTAKVQFKKSTFTCSVPDSLPKSKVIWQILDRDGKIVKEGDMTGVDRHETSVVYKTTPIGFSATTTLSLSDYSIRFNGYKIQCVVSQKVLPKPIVKSHTLRIKKAPETSRISFSIDPDIYGENESLYITCDIPECYPPPTVTWIGPKSLIDAGQKFPNRRVKLQKGIFYRNELRISSALREWNTKTVKCNVQQNLLKETFVTPPKVINVEFPPRMSEAKLTGPSTSESGITSVFTCIIPEANPVSEIGWILQNTQAQPVGTIDQFGRVVSKTFPGNFGGTGVNSTFYFSKITRAMNGYKLLCTAYHKRLDQTRYKTFFLRVKYPPSREAIMLKVEPKEPVAGRSARVFCIAPKTIPPPTLQWNISSPSLAEEITMLHEDYNPSNASQKYRYVGRTEFIVSGFEISNLKPKWNGAEMKCYVFHELLPNKKMNVGMQFRLSYSPNVAKVNMTGKSILVEDVKATFSCSIPESNPVSEVKWALNNGSAKSDLGIDGFGHVISLTTAGKIYNGTGLKSTLELTTVKRYMNGFKVICIVSQKQLPDPIRKEMPISVKYPPSIEKMGIKIDPQDLITGKSATVYCITPKANPQPSLIWDITSASLATSVEDISTLGKYKNKTDIVIKAVKIPRLRPNWNEKDVQCNVLHELLPNNAVRLKQTLNISYPPDSTTLSLSGSSILTEDVAATFVCTIQESNPTSNVKWLLINATSSLPEEVNGYGQVTNEFIKGEIYRGLGVRSTLRMTHVKRNMNGLKLACVVTQRLLSQNISKELILTVKYPPAVDKMKIVIEPKQLEAGKMAKLYCLAPISIPAPKLEWKMSSTSLSEAAKPISELGQFVNKSNLVIKVVEIPSLKPDWNEKDVQCNVLHELLPDNVVSLKQKLNISYPPDSTTLSLSGSSILTEDVAATFVCTIQESNPTSNVKWLLINATSSLPEEVNGYGQVTNEFIKGEIYRGLGVRSTLRMTHVKRNMNGLKLACVVTQRLLSQNISKELILTVKYPPAVDKMKIVIEPKQLEAGKMAKLYCLAPISIPAPKLEWKMSSTSLSEAAKPISELGPNKNQTEMVVIAIQLPLLESKWNERKVRCIVSHELLSHGFVKLKSTLRIFFPPTVENVKLSGRPALVEGVNSEFGCSVPEANPVSDVTWVLRNVSAEEDESLEDYGEVTNKKERGVYAGLRLKSTFSITRVHREMTGFKLSCVVSQQQLNQNFTKATTLKVKYRPDRNGMFIKVEPKLLVSGKTAKLFCVAPKSIPAPVLKWTFSKASLAQATKPLSNIGQYENNTKVVVNAIEVPRLTPEWNKKQARCHISHELLPNQAAELRSELEVQYPPDVSKVSMTGKAVLVENVEASYVCYVPEANPVSKVKWLLLSASGDSAGEVEDYGRVSTENIRGIFKGQGKRSIFHLTRVKRRMNDFKLVCAVSQVQLSQNFRKEIVLTVKYRPDRNGMFIKVEPKLLVSGKTAKLFCVAPKSIPPPILKWTFSKASLTQATKPLSNIGQYENNTRVVVNAIEVPRLTPEWNKKQARCHISHELLPNQAAELRSEVEVQFPPDVSKVSMTGKAVLVEDVEESYVCNVPEANPMSKVKWLLLSASGDSAGEVEDYGIVTTESTRGFFKGRGVYSIFHLTRVKRKMNNFKLVCAVSQKQLSQNVSKKIVLTVKYRPDNNGMFIKIEPKQLVSGKTAKLFCVAPKSIPPPMLKWTFSKASLAQATKPLSDIGQYENNTRVVVNAIEVPRLTPEWNKKQARCHISHELLPNQAAELRSELEVQFPPDVSKVSMTGKAVLVEDVEESYVCNVPEANPVSKVKWLLLSASGDSAGEVEDYGIVTTEYMIGMFKGKAVRSIFNLMLVKRKMNDFKLICAVVQEQLVQNVSKEVVLKIKFAPDNHGMFIKVEPKKLISGKSASLFCVAPRSIPPPVMEWNIPSESLASSVNSISNIGEYENDTTVVVTALNIAHLKSKWNTEEIECKVSHELLPNKFVNLHSRLEISYPPIQEKIRMSGNPVLVEDVQSEFVCHVPEANPVSHVTWSLFNVSSENEEPIGDYGQEKSEVVEGAFGGLTVTSTFTMLKVERNMNDFKLVCVVRQKQLSENIRREVTLRVKYPPATKDMSLVIEPKLLASGAAARIFCISPTAIPSPVLKWNILSTSLSRNAKVLKKAHKYENKTELVVTALEIGLLKREWNQKTVQCSISHELLPRKSTQLQSQLKISFPPDVNAITLTGNSELVEDFESTFVCSVPSANPVSDIKWLIHNVSGDSLLLLKNYGQISNEVSEGENGGRTITSSFKLMRVNRDMNGFRLVCVIEQTRLSDAITKEIHLRVKYAPDNKEMFIKIKPKTLVSGKAARLICIAPRSIPPPILKWNFTSSSLASSVKHLPKVEELKNATNLAYAALEVPVLKPQWNQAKFQCIVTQEILANKVILNSKLKISFPPNDLSVDLTGNPVLIEDVPESFVCNIPESNPASDVKWYFRNVSANSQSAIEGYGRVTTKRMTGANAGEKVRSTFKLTRVKREMNEFKLVCVVSHPFLPQNIIREVALQVKYAPDSKKMFIDIKPKVLLSGKSARLYCVTPISLPPPMLKWSTSSRSLANSVQPLLNLSKDTLYGNKTSLVVSALDIDVLRPLWNAKEVECIVTQELLPPTTLREKLSIAFPPRVYAVELSGKSNLVEDVKADFVCTVPEAKPVSQVTWLLINGTVRIEEVNRNYGRITSRNNRGDNNGLGVRSEFSMTKVKRDMNGFKVICVVSHRWLPENITKEITLRVKYPPDTKKMFINIEPTKLISGNSARLYCVSPISIPPPVMKWNISSTSLANSVKKLSNVGKYENNTDLVVIAIEIPILNPQWNLEPFRCDIAHDLLHNGRKTLESKLKILFPPNDFTIRLSGTPILVENVESEFVCEVPEANPVADVKWFIQNNDLSSVVSEYGEIRTETIPGRNRGEVLRSTFTLTQVKRAMNGFKLGCVISQQQLSKSVTKKVTIRVKYAPDTDDMFIRIEPADLISGQSGKMYCAAPRSLPLPKLKWDIPTASLASNAKPIPEFPAVKNDSFLVINALRVPVFRPQWNGKEVACIVSQELLPNKAIRLKSKLRVLFPPDQSNINLFGSPVMVEDVKTVFVCTVPEANPAPSVHWSLSYKNSEEMISGYGRIETETIEGANAGQGVKSTFYMTRVWRDMNGFRLICAVSQNQMAANVSKEVVLQVKYAPDNKEIFIKVKPNKPVSGKSARVYCVAPKSVPPPQMVWNISSPKLEKDAKHFTEGGIYENKTSLVFHGLEIPEITPEWNEVEIRCIVFQELLPNKVMNLKTRLHVLFPPEKILIDVPKSIDANASASFSCTASEANPPATIKWKLMSKNSDPIRFLEMKSKERFSTKFGKFGGRISIALLNIPSVPRNWNNATLTCQVIHKLFKEPQHKRILNKRLFIKYDFLPEDIKLFANPVIVSENGYGTYTCRVPDASPPARVDWTISSVLDTTNRSDITTSQFNQFSHTLKFGPLSRKYNGEVIKCNVFLQSWMETETRSVKVQIEFPPIKKLPLMTGNAEAHVGSGATFTCSGEEASPTVDLKWELINRLNESEPLQGRSKISTETVKGKYGGFIPTTSVIFKSIPRSMNGYTLRCRLKQKMLDRSYFEKVKFNLKFGPVNRSISLQQKPIYTQPGLRVVFICSAPESSPRGKLTWLYPKKLQRFATIEEKISVGPHLGDIVTSFLILKPTQHLWNDAKIRCTVKFNATKPLTEALNLKLKFPPMGRNVVISGPDSVKEGSEAVYQCLTSESLPAAVISWKMFNADKSFVSLQGIAEVKTQNLPGKFGGTITKSYLKVSPTASMNNYRIQCYMDHELGASVVSKIKALVVHFGPQDKRIHLIQKPKLAPAGRPAYFICDIPEASPRASVDWLVPTDIKPFIDIETKTRRGARNGKAVTSTLTIENMQAQWNGDEIQCTATFTGYGSTEKSISIRMRFPPVYNAPSLTSPQGVLVPGTHASYVCLSTESSPAVNITWMLYNLKSKKVSLPKNSHQLSAVLPGEHGGFLTTSNLTFYNLHADLSGFTIVCETHHPLSGVTRANTTIYLQHGPDPLLFRLDQDPRYGTPGGTLKLICNIPDSTPIPEITWSYPDQVRPFINITTIKKSGNRVGIHLVSTLTLQPIRHSWNRFLFRCEINHTLVGEQERSIRLHLKDATSLSAMDNSPSMGTVREGDSFISICTVRACHPQCSIYWTLKLKNRTRKILKTEVLRPNDLGGTVSKISFRVTEDLDGSKVICTLNDTDASLESNPLYIIGVPKVHLTILDNNIVEHGNSRFECTSTINRPRIYLCELGHGDRVLQRKDGPSEFYLQRITRFGGGWYWCRCHNSYGTNTNKAFLSVKTASTRLTVSQSNVEAVENSTINISCENDEAYPPAEIVWASLNKTAMQFETRSVRIDNGRNAYQTKSHVSLKVNRYDNGAILNCVAYNPSDGSMLVKSVRIRVLYPPSVHIVPSRDYPPEGTRNFSLECVSQYGNPNDFLYKWVTSSYGVLLKNKTVLSIPRLLRNNTGTKYKCVVTPRERLNKEQKQRLIVEKEYEVKVSYLDVAIDKVVQILGDSDEANVVLNITASPMPTDFLLSSGGRVVRLKSHVLRSRSDFSQVEVKVKSSAINKTYKGTHMLSIYHLSGVRKLPIEIQEIEVGAQNPTVVQDDKSSLPWTYIAIGIGILVLLLLIMTIVLVRVKTRFRRKLVINGKGTLPPPPPAESTSLVEGNEKKNVMVHYPFNPKPQTTNI